MPGGMRPSQRETPSFLPGQGSGRTWMGSRAGARVWGPAGLLDAPAWPLPLEKGLWQPRAREDNPGALERPVAPPLHPHAPTCVLQSPRSAVRDEGSALTPTWSQLPGPPWIQVCSLDLGQPSLTVPPWECSCLKCALLAPPPPPRWWLRGLPSEPLCPSPALSGSHSLCPSCTARSRQTPAQPSRSCVWGSRAPSAQGQAGQCWSVDTVC